MGPTKCPKCSSITASFDPRMNIVRCYRASCDWRGPDGFMYSCPVCHSIELTPDMVMGVLYVEQGSKCKRCCVRFAAPMWKGEL